MIASVEIPLPKYSKNIPSLYNNNNMLKLQLLEQKINDLEQSNQSSSMEYPQYNVNNYFPSPYPLPIDIMSNPYSMPVSSMQTPFESAVYSPLISQYYPPNIRENRSEPKKRTRKVKRYRNKDNYYDSLYNEDIVVQMKMIY